MQSYLRAIENNDVTSLPGSFFFLSFARQYAAVLGLDQAQVGRALAAVADSADKPTETGAEKLIEARSDPRSPVRSSPFQFSSRPDTSRQASPVRSLDPIVEDTNRRYFTGPLGLSWAGLLGAVLAGSGIFAWWTRPPQTVKAAPAKVVLRSAARAATGGTASGTPEVPVGETRGTDAAPLADGVSLQVAAGQVAAGQVAASVDDGKQVTLNLSATERTWLSITSHGKVIFSGVLEPSQTKTLQGSEVATMKVGNAGGVDVQWNGKSIGPIGARGQVRTIRFTRENFQFLEPESPDQL
jgi:cytoskeletal protein RodZ